MSAYAIGHLQAVRMGESIVEYLERIDATLAPFGGSFIVHGARPELLEGAVDGDIVAIEFPDMARARAWYASPAYRAILPLRTANSASTVFLIDGVRLPHKATDVLLARAD